MGKSGTLSFLDAYNMALSNATSIKSSQIVMVEESLNHILASDIIVAKNLPSFDNSAMDGFAFRYEDRGEKLKISMTIFAGDKPKASLSKGECYKIMTGAKVPSDADTIVPIEKCSSVSSDSVVIPSDIEKGSNFRKKGEEQKRGDILFKKGEIITSTHIALLSAQGIVAVSVYKPLQIAIISTGNEIKEPWEVADEDEIYNANAEAIKALLKENGFDSAYIGAMPDDLDRSISFIDGLKSYNLIISTGGISKGDADFTAKAFEENGMIEFFHGINIKPGHPTVMGKMDDTFIMAMPGNPLAAILNLFLISIPILFKMQGSNFYHHSYIYLKNKKTFKIKANRANIVLGAVTDGEFLVTRENRYGSGMLTPIVESSAIALFDTTRSSINKGEMIKVILLSPTPKTDKIDSINL